MREIKFRFYSKILKNFVTPNDDILAGALKDKKMVVMQFTGHTDMQGKEVYEGDLLDFNNGDKTLYLVKWDDREGAWSINYRESMPMAKIGMTPLMRVVGNVYENPELLK